MKAHNELAKQLIQRGHIIANHTQNHLNGWHTLNNKYQDDIRACDNELMELGVHNQLFRPPYGRIKKSQINSLKNRRIVMWSHLSWDFDHKLDVQKSINKMKEAKPGEYPGIS